MRGTWAEGKQHIVGLLGVGGAIVAATFVVGVVFGPGTWRAWWVSNTLHVAGGFYAFFFIRAVFGHTREQHRLRPSPGVGALLFVAGAMVLGVGWEWFELLLDRYNVWVLGNPSVMTYADNIADLGFDTMGALGAAYCFLARGSTKQRPRKKAPGALRV